MAFGCQPELTRGQIWDQFDIFKVRNDPKVLLTEDSLGNIGLMIFNMKDETWKQNPVYQTLEKKGILRMTLKEGAVYSARIEMSPAISVQTLALCGVQDYTLRPGYVEGAEAKLWDMGLNLATNLKVTFQITYNINRPEGLIALRKSMYHEFIEAALVYMNIVALGDPKYIRGKDLPDYTPGDAFTHDVTEQAMSLQLKDIDFYYWSEDDPPFEAWESQGRVHEKDAERLEGVALMLENQGNYIRANSVWAECADAWEKAARAWDASTFPKARERAKQARKEMEAALKKAGHWEVIGSPGKKVTIKYENWFGDFKATILDYANRWVDSLSVSSARDGKIDWGEKADPGLYKIEAGDGVKKEFKILPKKSLVLEAKFVRDSFGSLYLSIEYKNWPTGKRIGVRIIGPSGSELHSKETERTDGKLEWGKNHDFKPGEYTITAFVNQQYGDPFLKELLQKGQLVAPKKIKAPAWNVSSAGRYIVITYKNWIDRFRGEILDTSGKKMETFDKSSGDGKIEWGDNSKVEAGVYFVKVKLGSNKYEVKKAIILK